MPARLGLEAVSAIRRMGKKTADFARSFRRHPVLVRIFALTGSLGIRILQSPKR